MISEQLTSKSVFQDRTEKSVAQQWADFSPIQTGDDYLESIRDRGTLLYLFGERGTLWASELHLKI